jgi:hypothetical protein
LEVAVTRERQAISLFQIDPGARRRAADFREVMAPAIVVDDFDGRLARMRLASHHRGDGKQAGPGSACSRSSPKPWLAVIDRSPDGRESIQA